MTLLVTLGPVSAGHIEEIVAEAPINIRLTFSFGTPELQASRAEQIQRATENTNDVPIWASLSGATDRIGRIYSNSLEDTFQVEGAVPFKIVDAESIELDRIQAVPIPKIDSKRIQIGDLIIYGDNQCELTVLEIRKDHYVVRSDVDIDIVATRSVYFKNASPPNSLNDRNSIDELKFIFRNETLFSGIIVPDTADVSVVDELRSLISKEKLEKSVICSIERAMPTSLFEAILSKSDFVIIDRAKIALNDGVHCMPEIVWGFLDKAGTFRSRILVASNIATSASQGISSNLSCSELSDLWSLKKSGIAGVVLTEETAVHPSFLSAIRQIKAFMA